MAERTCTNEDELKRLRKCLKKTLVSCHATLGNLLKSSIGPLADQMYQAGLITDAQQDYISIVNAFKAHMDLMPTQIELEECCCKFLNALEQVGVPTEKAAKELEKSWIGNAKSEVGVDFVIRRPQQPSDCTDSNIHPPSTRFSDQDHLYETETIKESGGNRSEIMPRLQPKTLPPSVVLPTSGFSQESSYQQPLDHSSSQKPSDKSYTDLDRFYLEMLAELKVMFQNEKEGNEKEFRSKLEADIRELKTGNDKKHDKIVKKDKRLSLKESDLEHKTIILNIKEKQLEERERLLAEREESCENWKKLLNDEKSYLKETWKEREHRLQDMEVKLQGKFDQLEKKQEKLKQQELRITKQTQKLEDEKIADQKQRQERQWQNKNFEQQKKQLLSEYEQRVKLKMDVMYKKWKEELNNCLNTQLKEQQETLATQQQKMKYQLVAVVVLMTIVLILSIACICLFTK